MPQIPIFVRSIFSLCLKHQKCPSCCKEIRKFENKLNIQSYILILKFKFSCPPPCRSLKINVSKFFKVHSFGLSKHPLYTGIKTPEQAKQHAEPSSVKLPYILPPQLESLIVPAGLLYICHPGGRGVQLYPGLSFHIFYLLI